MTTFSNATLFNEYTKSVSNLITDTTTTSFLLSNWFLTYRSILKYISYILACLGVLIFILNIYVLIILLNCKSLNKHLKIQYIIQIVINIGIGFLYDITISFANFLYDCVSTYLINNFVFHNIFNIDLINVYTCVIHEYLKSVFEFIWMWNCMNFTTQRCLIICFPFLRDRITQFFSYPLYFIEIIFSCIMWWINIYGFAQGYNIYKLMYQNVLVNYPSCNNVLTVITSTWGSIYVSIASNYITYGIPEIFIILSNIVLIINLVQSNRNRKNILNINKQKQNFAEMKLKLSVIIISFIYFFITTPIIFQSFLFQLFNPTGTIYLIASVCVLFGALIGRGAFVLLRWADVIILILMVSELRILFFRIKNK